MEKLAYYAKIDEKNLGRIESGKQELYFITLYKISSVLNVTIDGLSDVLEYIIKLESKH